VRTRSKRSRGHRPGLRQPLLGLAGRKNETAGNAFFVLAILVVAVLAGLNLNPGVRLFVAGEVATQNVTADQNLLVEDRESTENKREQVLRNQPPVFDLSTDPGGELVREVRDVFATLNETPPEELDTVRWQIAERLNSEIEPQTLAAWRNNEFQNLVQVRVVPWLADRLEQGVAAEGRLLLQHRNGVLVRDLDTGTEILRQNVYQIPDLERLRQNLELALRQDMNLPLRTRKAVLALVEPLLHPSLTLNREATEARKQEVAAAVEPVYYQIKKGEMVVRKGERVSPQEQLKLQALFTQERSHFDPGLAAGVFVLGLLFAGGLVLAPAGPLFRPVSGRDAFVIGLIILVFAVLGKVMALVQGPLAQGLVYVTESALPLALPMAGAAGLLALFLPTQICLFANLILAFIGCQMVGGGLGLFAFYFLGAILNTVLVKRAQTRAQALKSVFPLLGGLVVAWLGTAFLHWPTPAEAAAELGMVLVGGLLSLLAVFALSPIVEMAFGYTSRFKLMELMNLEQPLLQEMMVGVPGTYHHSWWWPTWWRPARGPSAPTRCSARWRPCTTTSASSRTRNISSRTSSASATPTTSWPRP
jgi:hypothetical protein